MKLKDYPMPQYGLDGGADPDDLEQYSLKNFDLKAYQRTQQLADADPLAAACDGAVVPATEAPTPQPLEPTQWSATPEPPNEPSFVDAPIPLPTGPSPLALDPSEVHFGPHFNLHQPLYIPASPSQSWKMPRWVITMVGLFFGSAAVLTFACCVVLLRDPSPAPTASAAAPTAAVATTAAAPAPAASSAPVNKPPVDVARAPSVAHHAGPATTSVTHAEAAPGRRIVVSRHPNVVRRQTYGPRRVASRSASSSLAAQETETETASRRPPKDALDQLLSESAL